LEGLVKVCERVWLAVVSGDCKTRIGPASRGLIFVSYTICTSAPFFRIAVFFCPKRSEHFPVVFLRLHKPTMSYGVGLRPVAHF